LKRRKLNVVHDEQHEQQHEEQHEEQQEQETFWARELVETKKDWAYVEKGLEKVWKKRSAATLKTYHAILNQIKTQIPDLDPLKFFDQAEAFCSSRTSKCKLNQSRTVLLEIAEVLDLKINVLKKQLKDVEI
jgi:hypothetical protein